MELLTYLLKVSACTALFFGFYLLVLRKLTFFKVNRFYLLATLLLSFIIPALQFDLVRTLEPVEIAAPTFEPTVAQPITFEMPPLSAVADNQSLPEYKFEWYNLVSIGYALVALAILGFCIWKLLQLVKQTKAAITVIQGLKVIHKQSGFTNCSFFNYVFIDENSLSKTELSVLLAHEQVHARQYHSIDKILLMIFKALLWFNPIVYLYDKALEQTHEYEADEITSSNVGSQHYANLLLKLAVAKSDMPLIHNFVKSPIKDRIKMLFHSKSNKMKKLSYLLALPVTIGLVWIFAVQVVYAQATIDKSKDIKPAKDFFQGTLKGKVIRIEKFGMGYTFDCLADGKTYAIEATGFKEKIKVGDELIAIINGRMDSFKVMDKNGKVLKNSTKPIYYPTKITTINGKLIFKKALEKNAFMYEVNKARFASTKIKSIQKNTDGTLRKVVLNDGTFTINLNLTSLNLKDNNFKVGDQVVVKFIGEKLVSKNVYSTDKMIVITSRPKRYELRNESLYNRFYQKDGRQKVAALKRDSLKVIKPKIVSYGSIKGDFKDGFTYMTDAIIEINGDILKARKVEWDQAKNTITAKGASFENRWKTEIGDKMIFDLAANTHITFQPLEMWPGGNLSDDNQSQDDKIKYSAQDSVKFSKDRSIVTLFGNASISSSKVGKITGSLIIYNTIINSAKVVDARIYSKKINKGIKGDSINVDLKTGRSKIYGFESY